MHSPRRTGFWAGASVALALFGAGPAAAQRPPHPVWQCTIQTEPKALYYEVTRLLGRQGEDLGSFGEWGLRAESGTAPGLWSSFHAERGAAPIAASAVQLLWRPIEVERAENWRLAMRVGGAVRSYTVQLHPGGFTAEIPLPDFGLGRGQRYARLELIDESRHTRAQTRVDLGRLRTAVAATQRALAVVDQRARRFAQECVPYYEGMVPLGE